MCWQNTCRVLREVALVFFTLGFDSWSWDFFCGGFPCEENIVPCFGFARFVYCVCMPPSTSVQLRVCFRVTHQWTGRTSRKSQMKWLSSWNKWLKFKTSGKLPTIWEESMDYSLKKTQKVTIMNWLDLETVGFWLMYAHKSPRTLLLMMETSVLYLWHLQALCQIFSATL